MLIVKTSPYAHWVWKVDGSVSSNPAYTAFVQQDTHSPHICPSESELVTVKTKIEINVESASKKTMGMDRSGAVQGMCISRRSERSKLI